MPLQVREGRTVPVRVRQPIFYTVPDLCERWGCSVPTVYRRIRNDGLRAMRGQDGGYLVREDWLEEWETTKSKKQCRS